MDDVSKRMESLNLCEPITITPERFLERAQVKEIRSLVFLIFKKLQVELDPSASTAPHYLGDHSANLFLLAFKSIEDAQRTEKEVFLRSEEIVTSLKFASTDIFRSLPPLFLLSCKKFVIHYDDLILVAQKDGPIIPLVCLKSVRERSDAILHQLQTVYALESTDFMTMDKLNSLLTVPIAATSSSPHIVQKNTQWTPP